MIAAQSAEKPAATAGDAWMPPRIEDSFDRMSVPSQIFPYITTGDLAGCPAKKPEPAYGRHAPSSDVRRAPRPSDCKCRNRRKRFKKILPKSQSCAAWAQHSRDLRDLANKISDHLVKNCFRILPARLRLPRAASGRIDRERGHACAQPLFFLARRRPAPVLAPSRIRSGSALAYSSSKASTAA